MLDGTVHVLVKRIPADETLRNRLQPAELISSRESSFQVRSLWNADPKEGLWGTS
jgi:hypothetical protein